MSINTLSAICMKVLTHVCPSAEKKSYIEIYSGIYHIIGLNHEVYISTDFCVFQKKKRNFLI